MANPRRIAIVAATAPPYGAGGVASAHYNLFRALQARGFEARLFTFDDPHPSDDPAIVRHSGPDWLRWLLGRLSWLLFALLQPGRLAYQTRDIWQSQPGVRRMALAVRDFKPEVIILSDHGAPGLALPVGLNSRVILVSHHNPARFLDRQELGRLSPLDVRWALQLEQRVLARVDAVVCPSNYMRRWFERTYKFEGPVNVIPNLLDTGEVGQIGVQDPRPEIGLAAEAILIYMPAAGSRLKGANYLLGLIDCLAAQASNQLGIYLPGYVEPQVAAVLEGLPANVRLHRPGQQPYAAHIAAVKACSFGISPSVMENYSMALLEAVWCGVPMLAFDTGGNSDIIQEGQNGHLVPEGDAGALCRAATALLQPEALSNLQQHTLAYSRRVLAPEHALQAYVDLIQNL